MVPLHRILFSAIVLEYCTNKQYHLGVKTLTPSRWIAACAERLHERWHTVDEGQLEEVAVGLWQDTRLRSMEPAEAAAVWLLPLATDSIDIPHLDR
jgi:hypothetical protein